MGYACPVCAEPQADAGHLANHLAFTAMTGGADHETYLDEHVSEWGQLGESELAEHVVELADETEFPFEANGTHDHGHDHQHGSGIDTQQARSRGSGQLDDEAAEILQDAQELTEEMHEGATGDGAEDEATEEDADETQ